MLRRLLDWWRGKPNLGKRSPKWRKVRAEHLKSYPCCAACGGTKKLEVHHILPFHLFPAQELCRDNLMTLCEARGCHLIFGHVWSWKGWNPTAVEDALKFREKRRTLDFILK